MNIKSLIIIVFAATAFFSCNKNTFLFVGTYTSENKEGIQVLNFNKKTGSLTPVSHTENIQDPSYLALSKDKKFLYAVNEVSDGSGGVSSFSLNKKTGNLQLLNYVYSAKNLAPCFVALDKTNKFLTIANYVSGNFCVYPLANDGKILPIVQDFQFKKEGEKQPHVHTTVFSHDNRTLYVTDLGTDKLYQFSFDADNEKPVAENPKIYQLPNGNGPRHLVLNAKGNFLYLLNEWEGNIFVFEKMNDSLTLKQEIVSTEIINSNDKNKGSAAIKISPDGKFLYASNRGITNNIAIYKIGKSGLLTRIGTEKTDLHPRDFIIDNSGNFLLVASRDDNNIKTYKRNKTTGLLTFTGLSAKVSKPVMLLEY